MNLIVTVDENWAIGNRGARLLQIPADQRQFRKLTERKTVVMGRKTLENLPQGVPYHFCQNIILSEDSAYKVKNCQVIHSVSELLSAIEEESENVFICGGNSIYKQLLPHCDTVYVTMVEGQYDADEHLKNLDMDEQWEMVEESDEQTYFDIIFYFRKYVKRG